MKNNIGKKIGLICLCLSIFSLSGCFHVPDEDWLPSKNKAKTEEVKKNVEVEQAVNSFMDGINMISSQGDEIKDGENNEKSEDIAGTGGENVNIEEIIGNEEVVNNEEIINIRNDNQEIENATE